MSDAESQDRIPTNRGLLHRARGSINLLLFYAHHHILLLLTLFCDHITDSLSPSLLTNQLLHSMPDSQTKIKQSTAGKTTLTSTSAQGQDQKMIPLASNFIVLSILCALVSKRKIRKNCASLGFALSSKTECPEYYAQYTRSSLLTKTFLSFSIFQ